MCVRVCVCVCECVCVSVCVCAYKHEDDQHTSMKISKECVMCEQEHTTVDGSGTTICMYIKSVL